MIPTMSYSYMFPSVVPTTGPSFTDSVSPTSMPSSSPTKGVCSFADVNGQTFYASALDFCFKIEAFPGGVIEVNLGDNDCSQPFVGRFVGEYDSFSGNELYFVKGTNGLGGNGIIKFEEDATAPAPSIFVQNFVSSSKDYEFMVTVPSCTETVRDCLSTDIGGQTYIGTAAGACIQVEMFNGGVVSVDLDDKTCSVQDFTFKASSSGSITGNVCAFEGIYDGIVTVMEDGVPGTEFIMKSLDTSGQTFDLEIRLRSCVGE